MIRYRFVDEIRAEHPVKRVCDLLGWDRSSYYGWKDRQPARDAKNASDEDLLAEIRQIHDASSGTYGALRVTRALHRRGAMANRKRVARIMREHAIQGTSRRRRKSLTRQDRRAVPAKDLVMRDFTAPMMLVATIDEWLRPARSTTSRSALSTGQRRQSLSCALSAHRFRWLPWGEDGSPGSVRRRP